jgi:hypothetical protein
MGARNFARASLRPSFVTVPVLKAQSGSTWEDMVSSSNGGLGPIVVDVRRSCCRSTIWRLTADLRRPLDHGANKDSSRQENLLGLGRGVVGSFKGRTSKSAPTPLIYQELAL